MTKMMKVCETSLEKRSAILTLLNAKNLNVLLQQS